MDAERTALIADVLEHVARLGRELTAAHATPFGDLRLTRSQLDALFVLAHTRDSVTPSALAAALTITPGAVTQLVDGLRMHDLVESAPHPADGRARIIRLTPAARAQVEQFERDAAARLAPHFGPLTTVQLAQLGLLLASVTG